MSRENLGERPPLDVFKRAYLVANEAFNRHDFDAAFFGFHPDLEWHTVADVPGPRVMHGRRAVVQAFQGLLDEFPDWRVEPQEFVEAEEAILVRNIGTATGRESGVPIRQPFTQVWTFSEGRPILVREYLDHAEALEAVGLGE
jgi:ketosteroid isomerase-like protein